MLCSFSANFSEIFPPAAKKVIFAFEKSYVSKFSIHISLSLKEIFFPALFSEATKYRLSNLKFFFQILLEFSSNISCCSYYSYIHDKVVILNER